MKLKEAEKRTKAWARGESVFNSFYDRCLTALPLGEPSFDFTFLHWAIGDIAVLLRKLSNYGAGQRKQKMLENTNAKKKADE